ncbi:hypothetical protein KXV92_007055 [Aspergillus fumigatus]|nr:hypothetical protein KXW88_003825 [Aspergillus fumigatus]KAH2362108.1 hypothetical protein KXV98_006163 [Aspergillus fumigatus]KAH3183113.1 hypothetical protein KXV92_007055 [Aspergillus fumigatus]
MPRRHATPPSRNSISAPRDFEDFLKHNPIPLQKFSLLHNFSGENVGFLTSVAEWKSSLPKAIWDHPTPKDGNVLQLLRESYHCALDIYVKFVSIRHAEFPVNILAGA